MTTKTQQEIDAEKNDKPRCDLVSPYLSLSVGRGMGLGARKHGTPGGLGSYRVAGTEQARLRTHIASLERHIAELKAGHLYVQDIPPGQPPMLVMDAITSQVNILADIYFDPPQEPDEYDLRYKWPDGRGGVRVVSPVTVTVGSAFAAGAVEGEDPWKLPYGWQWLPGHAGYKWAVENKFYRMTGDDCEIEDEIEDDDPDYFAAWRLVRARNREGAHPRTTENGEG